MFGVMHPEDKEKICRQLCRLLQQTRDQGALQELRYERDEEKKEEYVIATYLSGRRQRICVTLDNAFELIRDVVRKLK